MNLDGHCHVLLPMTFSCCAYNVLTPVCLRSRRARFIKILGASDSRIGFDFGVSAYPVDVRLRDSRSDVRLTSLLSKQYK